MPNGTRDEITFRVYLGGLYYRVHVWRTRRLMYRAAPHIRPCNWAAACDSADVYRVSADGRVRKTACLGDMHFYWRGLGASVLVHEATHAALWWAKRVGVDPTAPPIDQRACADEERFAATVEDVTWQLANRIVAHQLARWGE